MSRYENYEIKNNVFGTLSAPISSLATTIQLGDGQGQRFSVNQLATLENIENGKVMKREIVLITAINGDVLTVTRKYAPCPSNDDANTQGQVSYAFSADDTISVYITKEHLDIINTGIKKLETEGNDRMKVLPAISGSPLKVDIMPGIFRCASDQLEYAGLTDYSLIDNADNYISIDGNGNIVNQTIGRDTRYTRLAKVTCASGEITKIVDWRMDTLGGNLGELLIHELTEKTNLKLIDEFILSDSDTSYTNKRVSLGTVKEFVLKDKSTLSSLDYICGENLAEGDIIYLEKGLKKENATDVQTFGNSATPKVAIKQCGKGAAGKNITLQLGIVYGETPTDDLSLRIESDSGGKPSGSLLSGTTEQTIPLSLFKGGWGDVATDVGSKGNFYTAFSAGSPLMSADGKQVILYNQSSPSTARRFSLSTPYDFTSSTDLGACSLPVMNNNYYHFARYVDDGKKMLYNVQGNNTVRLYNLGTAYDASSYSTYTSASVFGSFTSITMTDDGKHVVAFEFQSSYRAYRVYELSTAFNMSTATLTGTYTFSGNQFYGQSIAVNNEGTVIIYTCDRSGLYGIWRLSTTKARDFSTDKVTRTQLVASVQGSLTVCNGGKNAIALRPYDIYSYSIESNQKKGIDFQLSSNVTIPLGTPFHLVITPTENTNAQFELYYGTKNGTIMPYSTNNGTSWSNVSNKEAYCLTDFSMSSYYMKQTASDTDKMGEIKVVQGAFNQREVPYFDFEGISRHFSGLTSGLAYYLSDTAGKVSTTPGTNVKFIGIAKSDKEIELATKNIVPIMSLSNVVQTSSTTKTILKQFDIKFSGTYKLSITYGMLMSPGNTSSRSKLYVDKSDTTIWSDEYILSGGCATIVFTANGGETVVIAGLGYSAVVGFKITQVVLEKIDVVDGYVENVID